MAKDTLWTIDVKGRGCPVVAGDRVYSLGYVGDKQELREVFSCIDINTGKVIWQHKYSDFISDIIYDRYSIGSPAIDPKTGNIYVMTTPGLLLCYKPDGEEVWRISLMERYGKMSFPNGRTGSPMIFGNMVIFHGITSNWGKQGPPRSRFYAFDKTDGTLIWSSTPGIGPKDSSFSTAIIGKYQGRYVMYAGTGCGNLVCFDVATGTPIWRYVMCVGGVNSSPLIYKDTIIQIHGKENIDSSTKGRMIAVKIPSDFKYGEQKVLDKSSEVWRQKLSMFTSSPILVGNRVYQVDDTGNLHCINADTGKILWSKKLGSAQIHASPLYADGKLYVPILSDATDEESKSGLFYILKPSDSGCEVLSKNRILGKCLGAPAVYGGRVLVHTTSKLYCFGSKEGKAPNAYVSEELTTDNMAPAGAKVAVRQILPAEVLLKPGEKTDFICRELDDKGRLIRVGALPKGEWSGYIPPTAKVKASMKGKFINGELVADKEVVGSAGAYRFSAADGLKSVIRARVLPADYTEDFESFNPTVPRPAENTKFAWPPLAWIGARFKWEIREIDGNKCLVKVQDRLILQRATSFIGFPEMSEYTLEADVMTGGNRRVMSDVGVVNQRYNIALKGTTRTLEISSNLDRMHVIKPFRSVKANTWYRLKTRVKNNADGSGVIYVKCWKKSDAEPAEWTIEAKVDHIHQKGAPALYGFSPGGLKPVFVDNVKVTSSGGSK
jgi:outer membrane protein assembly factor BamB